MTTLAPAPCQQQQGVPNHYTQPQTNVIYIVPQQQQSSTYPGYKGRAGEITGYIQLVCGIASVCLGIVPIVYYAHLMFGIGIWCGVMFIVTGSFGISTKNQGRCFIITYLVLSIIAANFAGSLLINVVFGVIIDVDQYYWYNNPAVVITADSLLLLTSVVELVTSIVACALCCGGSCCSNTATTPQQGVTYSAPPHGTSAGMNPVQGQVMMYNGQYVQPAPLNYMQQNQFVVTHAQGTVMPQMMQGAPQMAYQAPGAVQGQNTNGAPPPYNAQADQGKDNLM